MSCYRTRKKTQHPTGIARQSYATNLDPFVRLLGLVEVHLCLPVAAKHGLVLHTDADVSRASEDATVNTEATVTNTTTSRLHFH